MSRYSVLMSRIPADMDAVIISSAKNQRYLSRFSFSDGYLLLTRKAAVLLTDFRYIEAAKREAAPEFTVITKGRLAEAAAPYLEEVGAKVIGYENYFVTCQQLESFKAQFPGYEFAPMGTVIEDMRIFKDEEEIGNMIKAQRIAENALSHLLSVIHPNMTEIEVAAELEYAMRKRGAEGTAFETIAVSGTMSACPHGVPRNVKLEKGFLTLDFGAIYNGYCSDMTRTFVLGKADEEMSRVYHTVLKAQNAAIEFAQLGRDCAEVDKVARDIIDNAGYRGLFGHSLGHGVGMFIHERPGFSAGQKNTPIQPGYVLTVEPGIYIEGKYGVRIEDMVVCYQDRVEDITLAPKEMIELF